MLLIHTKTPIELVGNILDVEVFSKPRTPSQSVSKEIAGSCSALMRREVVERHLVLGKILHIILNTSDVSLHYTVSRRYIVGRHIGYMGRHIDAAILLVS